LNQEEIVTSELINQAIAITLDANELADFTANKEMVMVKTFADGLRYRINLFYQRGMPAITFYYLPDLIETSAKLNLPPIVTELASRPNGLLIIAGSHGCGKTTTSASLLEQINQTESKRIITLEQPIEYSFISQKSIVEQRQIGRDTLTLVSGLQYCLNEDVDVVFVGEPKQDLDKAVLYLLELASGNCLVILEMNAQTTINALEKILSNISPGKIEAARHNLADVLIGVAAQKLYSRRGGGLIPAVEILLGNSTVRSLIREGRINQVENVLQTSRKEGMVHFARAVEDLVRANEIKPDESTPAPN
jgi:twitching motility protein PilT